MKRSTTQCRNPGGRFPCQSPVRLQFAMVLFTSFAFFSNSLSAAPQTIVNKKDLDAALKTAKTSEDHQRIATYYQEQAEKLQLKEKEERDLANYYSVLRAPASARPRCKVLPEAGLFIISFGRKI